MNISLYGASLSAFTILLFFLHKNRIYHRISEFMGTWLTYLMSQSHNNMVNYNIYLHFGPKQENSEALLRCDFMRLEPDV